MFRVKRFSAISLLAATSIGLPSAHVEANSFEFNNPFHPDRKPVSTVQKESGQLTAADIVVEGVTLSAEHSVAILRLDGALKKTLPGNQPAKVRLKVGDDIGLGNKLVSIRFDRITLSNNGSNYDIPIVRHIDKGASPPAPIHLIPVQTGAAPTPNPPQPEPAGTSAAALTAPGQIQAVPNGSGEPSPAAHSPLGIPQAGQDAPVANSQQPVAAPPAANLFEAIIRAREAAQKQKSK